MRGDVRAHHARHRSVARRPSRHDAAGHRRSRACRGRAGSVAHHARLHLHVEHAHVRRDARHGHSVRASAHRRHPAAHEESGSRVLPRLPRSREADGEGVARAARGAAPRAARRLARDGSALSPSPRRDVPRRRRLRERPPRIASATDARLCERHHRHGRAAQPLQLHEEPRAGEGSRRRRHLQRARRRQTEAGLSRQPASHRAQTPRRARAHEAIQRASRGARNDRHPARNRASAAREPLSHAAVEGPRRRGHALSRDERRRAGRRADRETPSGTPAGSPRPASRTASTAPSSPRSASDS